MNAAELRQASEEVRHDAALALTPAAAGAVDALLALLGDPSWRVRKAALSRFERFAERADLAQPLVDGLADSENAGLRSACAEALVRLGEPAVPALVAALGKGDVDQRKFVVEVLGALRAPAARDALVAALDDADDNVRSQVADALGRFGGEAAVQIIKEKLSARAGDLQLAAYGLDALARLGARLSFAELQPWIGKAGLERLVYPLLGLSGDPKAARLLGEAALSASRSSRAVAVRALATLLRAHPLAERTRITKDFASLELIDKLLEVTSDEDDGSAEGAVVVLGSLAEPKIAARLLESTSFRPFVQPAVQAVVALGSAAVRPLIEAYEEAPIEARILFLDVLEQVGDASARPLLVEVALGNEPRTAEAALRVLAKVGGAEAVDALVRVGIVPDSELSQHAALALTQLGVRAPELVATRVRAALEAGDVRPALIAALGSLGRPEDVELIVASSHHDDPEVRCAAIEAFLSFQHRVDEGALVMALADENPRVRTAAARVLGSYHSERAAAALVVATQDGDTWVVAEALRSLGAVGGDTATQTLLAAAASSNSYVAIAALQSLFRLNPPNLAGAVRAALGHADPEVVREAVQTSMRLSAEAARDFLVDGLGHRSWHVRLASTEMLATRGIDVADDIVAARLASESEALVREALERLAKRGGTPR